MVSSESEVTALIDRFGDEVVVTLVLPKYLADVAVSAAVELRRACEASGSDAQTAELAGVLVGLLEDLRVISVSPERLAHPIRA